MPNECCPPPAAESINYVQFSSGPENFMYCDVDPRLSNYVVITGPKSATMVGGDAAGFPFASRCGTDPGTPVIDIGHVIPVVNVYSGIDLRVPMGSMADGVSGLASLYHSVFIIDGSYTAWNGSGTNIKIEEGGTPVPTPDLASVNLAGEEQGLQPRPGTMPGLYIYQDGSAFHQYGGPIDSGANPQTTAIYEDLTDAPGTVVMTNQLSGAQLWWYKSAVPPYLEVKHVDGTIARFNSFASHSSGYQSAHPNKRLWRLSWVRDPYDNQVTYQYDENYGTPLNHLTSIRFPSGLSQHFTYSMTALGGGWDSVAITYQHNLSSPTEATARNWMIAFDSASGPSGGRYFGRRLFRTYSAARSMLVDLSSPAPYTFSTSPEVSGQIVHEFSYVNSGNTRVMKQEQRVHTGVAFAGTLTTSGSLPDKSVYEAAYDANGKIVAQLRPMVGETDTYSYPAATRTTDLLPGTVLRAIQVTNPAGTAKRLEYDLRNGRVYSIVVTPDTGSAGRPRAAHVSTENNGIGGVAASDVEPESMTLYNIFDASCVCQKPIESQIRSVRGGALPPRVHYFEYDPTSKLVTRHRAPNPEAGVGPLASHVEWVYTYTRASTVGQSWGAWLPLQETTPDGVYNYSYDDWINRVDAGQHGQIPGRTRRSITDIRVQTSLSGSSSVSGAAVEETVWLNLAGLAGGLPKSGSVSGQPRQVIDGDGVSTVYTYTQWGHLESMLVAGSIRTEFAYDAVGNMLTRTSNAGSSHASVATLTPILAFGVPSIVTASNAGLTRESRGHYDRWGHLAVVRRKNLASNGAKPTKHGAGSSSARDWVEVQYHYHHNRLAEIYEDRRPLDEPAGGTQFMVTKLTYGADGRLDTNEAPNGAKTHFTFDGYGTLYKTVTESPDLSATVRGPKSFISPFLDVTGIYESTSTSPPPSGHHLWTTLVRNTAGAVVQVVEPSGPTPVDYTPFNLTNYSVGGAKHEYELDKFGRVVRARTSESHDGGSTWTLLAERVLRHDQLDRQIWQQDSVLGFGSGSHYKAWRYGAGKATQLENVESSGVAPTTYEYFGTGLLKRVRDGFGAGNTVDIAYHSQTPFVATVMRTDVDPLTGTRLAESHFLVDSLGQTTELKEGSGANDPKHVYAYNSFGQVDRYTDPAGHEQEFLPDARGRIVEHVRLGAGSAAIHNGTTFDDFGVAAATDGRTRMSRSDGLGNLTVTYRDFAGRPFIVQNPGGDVMPTASSPNQPMSLYAEYDGASRLSALYDGSLGKTVFHRDGRGRVILRQLVNQVVGGASSEDKIAQWNTKDWIRRDAIGRVRLQDYWGTPSGGLMMGLEQFDQDSLGRVHAERFVSAFAPARILETKSTFTGGDPFRDDLEYQNNFSGETAKMSFGRDAIGRLSEVQWDRAPGAIGSMNVLAQYGWAGDLRRTRTVRYGSGQHPQGLSTFDYDAFGRLKFINDDVNTGSGPPTTKSRFDYEYDASGNLAKEHYAKVNGRVGDRFAYDAYNRLEHAWMGVDATTMGATQNPTTDPLQFNSAQVHERLTYGLDNANNRSSSSSQTAAAPAVTSYTRQGATHPQGASNRYDTVSVPGAATPVLVEYDDRGNLTYDGKFVFKYDYMNRLQEVWRVVPSGAPVEDAEKFGLLQEGAVDDAQEEVKRSVPDLYTRLVREHTNPTFRSRLRATITGGVIRITPSPGGGGMPSFIPVSGTLDLAAVYLYDAFNRRTLSVLVDPAFAENQIHTWDGWRQTAQHSLVGDIVTPTKQFVWGSRLDELVAYRRFSGSTWETYYLLHGGQDTAAKLVDSTGSVVEQYEYDPYGRVTVYNGAGAVVDLGPVGASPEDGTASAKGLPFLWKGIRFDDVAGLLYMRNRYYSASLGRFLTRDPLGVWGDPLNLGSESAYACNNPLVVGDPLGLQGDRARGPGPGAEQLDALHDRGPDIEFSTETPGGDRIDVFIEDVRVLKAPDHQGEPHKRGEGRTIQRILPPGPNGLPPTQFRPIVIRVAGRQTPLMFMVTYWHEYHHACTLDRIKRHLKRGMPYKDAYLKETGVTKEEKNEIENDAELYGWQKTMCELWIWVQ